MYKMDNKMVENNHEALTESENQPTAVNSEEESTEVDIELIDSIKNFMDDLSSVTDNQNFMDYHAIVNRIDETKVKAYLKLIKGFKVFFDNNTEVLNEGNFDGLNDPNISYVAAGGSFAFNIQKTFQEAEEGDQDVIKDHLNYIWNILNNTNKGPEEVYIDKIFKNLKARFSPDLTREEQMAIAKDLFSDFQKQNLDISIVVKVACQKARNLLLSNGSEDHSQTLVLIDAVEDIDINNFNMIQFMGLVGKIGTLFADGEHNPLNGLLSSVFADNNLIPIDQLNLEDDSDH
jgi:hypothetical protein